MTPDMAVTIETASIHNLDRLYQIETECFEAEAFTKQQIAGLLRSYNSISLVAKEDSEIVGFIISNVFVERSALNGHILTIDVLPKHRLRGIGGRLLQEVEKIFVEKGVKASYLEVREGNVAALGLYQRFGYKKVGRLENYYGNSHGIYLRKALT